ncbi:hypothetical protein CDEST_08248 [Colletotrichum destructivum]|uniref:Uncharacterized protein n=1 Tax=Colletotrichum destructivum TaxID=34406 RepID=A0AAX4IIX3_9PEZI|nr:hypothetical protein CDEST_08248 [Colletotrichum destructivum]
MNKHASKIIINDSWSWWGRLWSMGNRESAQCDDQCARYSREPLPLTATSGINDLGLSCWQHHSQNNGAPKFLLGPHHSACPAQARRVLLDVNEKLISWFGELLLGLAHLRPFLSSALEACLNKHWHAVRKGQLAHGIRP